MKKQIVSSYKLRSEKYEFLKLYFTDFEIDCLMENIKKLKKSQK